MTSAQILDAVIATLKASGVTVDDDQPAAKTVVKGSAKGQRKASERNGQGSRPVQAAPIEPKPPKVYKEPNDPDAPRRYSMAKAVVAATGEWPIAMTRRQGHDLLDALAAGTLTRSEGAQLVRQIEAEAAAKADAEVVELKAS